MAGEDKHKISLVIEAQNLSSDEIEAVAYKIDGLGQKAIEAEKALNNLKLDETNLGSFKAVNADLDKLKQKLFEAEIAYEDNAKALKKRTDASDEDRIALKKEKDALGVLRKEVKSTQTTYDNLRKKIKQKLEQDEELADYQKRLQQEIKSTAAESERLNNEYEQEVRSTRELIAARKDELKGLKDLDVADKKAIAAAEKQADADAKAIAEKQKLVNALDEYQLVMSRLTAERDRGVISAKDYIQEEIKLRDRLQLTTSAVRDRKASLEAEAKEVTEAAKKKEKAYADEVAAIKRKEKALKDEVAAIVAADRAQEASFSKNHVQERIQNVKKYEAAIKELLAAKRNNDITTAEFNNAERKLRQELKLTEAQAKKTQLAIATSSQGMGKAAKATDALTQVTRRLAQAYTVLIAAQGATQAVTESVKSYGDLEKAMIGVEKTTGASRKELEAMTEQLVEMSKDVTPTAATELANMATVAGQLGVKGAEDITKLVATVDALENSTNLAGEEAATLLTRILNLSGEGVGNIDRLGSVFVELGNNFAVAEDEIAHMTQEIITGTTAIDLGAAAAAAFGAALKVSGQQAERSRSAMFRLSQGIKSAVLEGGESLEDLANITGMTASELEKNLGERPEQVLLATVKGFAKVRDEGGLLTDVLSRMGIEGVESTAVLEALAKNVDTLEEMLGSANEQWKNNTALMDEALKAYASQDAAIGRLVNRFEDLKVKIGEALADETEQAIQDFTHAIENGGGAVVGIVEDIFKLYEGIKDLIGTFDLWVDSLLGIGSVWNGVFNIMRAGLNSLTMTMTTVVVGWKEIWFEFRKALGASQKELDGIRESINKLRKSANDDFQDVIEAVEDLHGTSSDAYRDLVKATDDYKDHLHLLTDAERERLGELNGVLRGERELDGERRKMTATLVSLGRQEEMRAKETEKRVIASYKEASAARAKAEADAKLEQQLKSLGMTHEQVNRELEVMQDALDAGIAVSDEFTERMKLLQAAQSRFVDSLAADEVQNQTDAIGDMTDAEIDLTRAVEDKQRALDKINTTLQDNSIKGKARLKLLRDQKDATNDLKDAEKKLQLTRELENKTIFQLKAVQEQHNLQMELLEQRYQNGTIKAGDYIEQKQQLSIQTEILNRLIGDSARENDKDASATRKNADSKKKLAEAQREANKATKDGERLVDEHGNKTQQATQYTSLYAQAQQHLKKNFDYTSLSIEELGEKYDVLQDKININRRVTSLWWVDTAKAWNAAFEREQRYITETKTMKKWQQQVDSGRLSLQQLSAMAENTDTRFRYLDSNDLSGLRSSIEAAADEIRQAQEETRQFAETVEDALNSAKDRLYQLNDEREKSLNLQYDADIAELEMLKVQAEARGETASLDRIREAIRLTEEARAKELANIAEDRRQEKIRQEEDLARELEQQRQLADNQQKIDESRNKQIQGYTQQYDARTNATIAELELKIKNLEAAQRSAGLQGTTIVLQSGDRQAYINGVVDEVLDVLEQAGLRV